MPRFDDKEAGNIAFEENVSFCPFFTFYFLFAVFILQISQTMVHLRIMDNDEICMKIITELQKDGRATFRDMAHRFGVSPGTVRSRFNHLREIGALKVLGVPDPRKLGLTFHATVALNLEPGNSKSAARSLASRPEVGWIGLVVSGFDVMFEIAVADAQAFARFKEEVFPEISGFISSTAYIMWDVRKFHYEVTPSERIGFATDDADVPTT